MKNKRDITSPLQNTDFDKNNIPDITPEDVERFKSSKAFHNFVGFISHSFHDFRSVRFIGHVLCYLIQGSIR